MKPKNKGKFIKELATMSPEEINALIINKGKKPKPYRGFIRVVESKDQRQFQSKRMNHGFREQYNILRK